MALYVSCNYLRSEIKCLWPGTIHYAQRTRPFAALHGGSPSMDLTALSMLLCTCSRTFHICLSACVTTPLYDLPFRSKKAKLLQSGKHATAFIILEMYVKA